MKLIKHNRHQIVLRAQGKEVYQNSLIFDLALIVPCRTARWIRIEHQTTHTLERWEMPWKKFLREHCIGDLVMIDKDNFKYSVLPLATGGQ